MLTNDQKERYSRQVLLGEIGEAGQRKLINAKVLVVGAGGLGCPVLQYLVAAGVGTIGIADDDSISASNLHRQILYGIDDVGKLKTTIAAQKVKQLNPQVQLKLFEKRITNLNAWDIISAFDIVVDGSDNFTTRYLVNDACVLQGKPLIYGSVFKFEGQVAVFNLNGSVNYRDVFSDAPGTGEVPDCAEAGVLGVLPGIIGNLMANETIKLIVGMGKPLTNRLLTYNSLENTFYEIELSHSNKHPAPVDKTDFESWDYELSCSVDSCVNEIDLEAFEKYILIKNAIIVDVREQGELPIINTFDHLHLSLSELKQNPVGFKEDTIVLFCQSGKRSLQAAALLIKHNPNRLFKSLKGGIPQWHTKHSKQQV